MDALVSRNAHGDITLHISGGLSFESNLVLKRAVNDLVTEHPVSTVTLDMNNLDFVGSSGISNFVDTLNSFTTHKKNIKLTNVSSEFVKIFKLYKLNAIDSLIHSFEDDETEDLSQNFGNRKFTFEN